MLGITWKGPRAMGVGTLQTDDGGFQLPSTMKETMEENRRIASPVPLLILITIIRKWVVIRNLHQHHHYHNNKRS